MTDIAQASSYLFWRPTDQRWTVSGGLRAMEMKGHDTAQSSDQRSFSGSAGAFYQYTQRLRFDGSATLTKADVTGASQGSSSEHLGVLYQSDLALLKGFTYQWFANGAVDNQDDPDTSQQSLTLSLGHDAEKTWWTGQGSTLRFSINQSINEDLQTGGGDAINRLDHSATLGWNQSAGNGTSLLQLTPGGFPGPGRAGGCAAIDKFPGLPPAKYQSSQFLDRRPNPPDRTPRLHRRAQ